MKTIAPTLVQSLYILFSILIIFGSGPNSWAQQTAGGTVYKSEIDELLTIASISTLPITDNVQGIYSRPIETYLIEKLNKMHRWSHIPLTSVGALVSPEELAEDIEKTKQISSNLPSDAFLATRISKGPNGVSIIMSLFLKKDGRLLASSQVKDLKRFDITELTSEIDILLNKIIAQIPYQGKILSRDNQRVTLNIGTRDGIKNGQIVSVVQIIGLNRHPKFNFIINTEKEIIGRVKLLKIEDTLSFGMILSEKEKGAIRKDAKISGLDFINYPISDTFSDPLSGDLSTENLKNKISFGENPSMWVPQKSPTFGQVGARLGNTIYSSSLNLTSVENLSSSSNFAPSVSFEAELWVTSQFSVHANFKQGIIPIDNPRTGAAPNTLNQSLTTYDFLMGYNYRFGNGIWAPWAEVVAGYQSYKLYVDSSSPQAYTTMNYSCLKTGVRGSFPVSLDQRWHAGAEMFISLMPRLSETPITSGASSTSTINMFGVFGAYKFTENIKLLGKLDFEQYTSSFSGSGTRTESASSSSQRHTTLSGGVYYLF